jgi:flavin reductase (DIM6/NTAB) family NADH-FMN oxidoreductase RutF
MAGTRLADPMSSDNPAEALTEQTDYPIYVVCVDHAGQKAGCVAGFVTQCSIDPVRFLVCVSKANHTYEVGKEAAAMSLHLLGSEQHDLAELFGHLTGDSSDKFERTTWKPGKTGAPVLQRCAAWIEGEVLVKHDVGDHVAFLLTPVSGGAGPEDGQLTVAQSRDITPGHPA